MCLFCLKLNDLLMSECSTNVCYQLNVVFVVHCEKNHCFFLNILKKSDFLVLFEYKMWSRDLINYSLSQNTLL